MCYTGICEYENYFGECMCKKGETMCPDIQTIGLKDELKEKIAEGLYFTTIEWISKELLCNPPQHLPFKDLPEPERRWWFECADRHILALTFEGREKCLNIGTIKCVFPFADGCPSACEGFVCHGTGYIPRQYTMQEAIEEKLK